MSDTTGSQHQQGLSRMMQFNLWVVAFSVAIVAWFFARSEQVNEAGVMIPVKLRGSTPYMEVRVQPDTLRAYVRYPAAIQGSVNGDNMIFDLNINDMFPDLDVEWQKKTIQLDQNNLVANVPQAKEVRLIGQERNPLRVNVEARWKAWQADVEPVVSGEAQLAERGLVLGKELRVTPRQVWLVGSQEKLGQLKRDPVTQRYLVQTERIMLSDYSKPVLQTVRFELPPGLEIVKPQSGTGELSLDIQEITTEREMTTVPLTRHLFASETLDTDIDTSYVQVRLRGPQSLLKRLDPASIQILPMRPPEELPDTTREVKLDATLKSELTAEFGTRITIMGVTPPSVTVHYRKKGQ